MNDDFGIKELIDTIERDAQAGALNSNNQYTRVQARLCLGTVAGYKAKHPELWEEHSMTWHKIDWNNKDTLPSKSGWYLCRSILGTQGGKCAEGYGTFFFGDGEFVCDDFIITHWAGDFNKNKPEDV